MAEPRAAPLPERLLLEREWITGLARSLVGDAADADDVAQEALLAAWRRPPAAGSRAWLAAVIRNLARRRRRGAERRRAHEERAARTGAEVELPATAELVARAELQRLLAERVLALAEPQRTAVLLRYFEGLSSAEIARRQGVPAATVRSRLRRALAELRAELDHAHGERGAWRPVLAAIGWPVSPPLPASPSPSGAPPSAPGAEAAVPAVLVPGVLVMKTIWITVLAAAAVTAALVFVPFLRDSLRDVGPGAALGDARAALVDQPQERRDAPAADEPTETANAREAAPASAPAPKAQAAPVAPETPRGRVTARIVGAGGHPLAGATLTDPEGGASATSAADGAVALELDAPAAPRAPRLYGAAEAGAAWSAELLASHPSHARRFLRVGLVAAETAYLGDVALAPAGSLAGLIVDEDGNPRADVSVLVAPVEHLGEDPEKCRRHGPELPEPGPSATSAADGNFRIEELPVGHLRLWAGGAGLSWSTRGPLEVREGEVTEVLVEVGELRADDFLRGVVQSPAGEPISGAGVSWFYVAGHVGTGGHTTCGPDGEFAFLVDHRVPHDLTVVDPQDRWGRVRLTAEPGDPQLVVSFRESRWLPVRIVCATEPPAFLLSAGVERADGEDWTEIVQVPAGARATRIRVPEEPFCLTPNARGYEASRLGPYDPLALPAEVELVLRPLPGVRGRVLLAGRPAAGAAVRLRNAARSGEKLLANGFPCLFQPYDRDVVTADDAGRFELQPEEAGPYVISAELAGEAAVHYGPLELDPAVGADGLELELLALGAIAGRVLLPPGEAAEGLILGYHRGDGRPRTLRLGADGEYLLEDLIAGPWQVRVVEAEILPGGERMTYTGDPNGASVAFDCEVFPGEVTRFDLDLSAGTGAAVRGRLRLAGEGAAGWTATLVDRSDPFEAEVHATAVLGADGTFRLPSRGPGRRFLELVAPAGANGRLVLSEELVLGADELVWDVDYVPAALEGSGVPAETGSETLLEYRFEGEVGGRALSGLVRILPDSNGSFRLGALPPGPGRIAVFSRERLEQGRGAWVDEAEFVALPGETLRVQLP